MAYVTRPTSYALLFLYFIGIFASGSRANVIDDCDNLTSCIETFADLYYALASDENSFNIESALYPAMKPSSILVTVNISGQNGSRKTDNSIPDVKKYTWSLNCLYAAFPAAFLEILSLGAIVVTPRMQKLNITIPHFCCNVTVEKRRTMIRDVLATLQDLAVNPSLRDPRLNSAECITEEHIPNIEATGHGPYLRAVLWCSFLCVMILSPLSMPFALGYLEKHSSVGEVCVLCSIDENAKCPICCKFEFCNKGEKPLIRSAAVLCVVMLLMEVVLCAAVLGCNENSTKGNLPPDFYVIIAFIVLECCIEIISLECCKSLEDWRISSFHGRALLIVSTKLVLCHLCWVAIGIMINPTWGLSVLLIISFSFVMLSYFIYEMCSVEQCISYTFLTNFFLCTAAFFGVCFAFVPPTLAGKSFYGRETADDILKTALLYAIGAVSWLYLKSLKSSPNIPKCAKAATKAAAAAKALAEKISVSESDRTGVESLVATAAAGALASAAGAAAAAEAVANAVAKMGDSSTGAKLKSETVANENGESEELVPDHGIELRLMITNTAGVNS